MDIFDVDFSIVVQKQFENLLNDVAQNGICEQVKRAIVFLSNEARYNSKIKDYLTEKIEIVEKERIRPKRWSVKDFDESAIKIYRAMYLDGNTRPTARQLGIKFNYDKRTICRKRDYAISALAVVIAGLFGIDWQNTRKSRSDEEE